MASTFELKTHRFGKSTAELRYSDQMPMVVTSPLGMQIVAGNIARMSCIDKFGHNPTVAGATEEVIWAGEAVPITFSTTPTAAHVYSADATDGQTAGSASGAGKITLIGLGANYSATLSDTITLTGATTAVGTALFTRVFRAYVSSPADNSTAMSTNVGTITINHGASGSLLNIILAGEGQTESTWFTVPAGKTGFITDIWGSLNRATGVAAVAADVILKSRGITQATVRKRYTIGLNSVGSGHFHHHFVVPTKIDGATDIWLSASASASADVAGGYGIILIDN